MSCPEHPEWVHEAESCPLCVGRRLRRFVMGAELADAIALLKQLVAPCDGAPNGHGWRKCKRCMAVHGVEERFSLSMSLLHAAIEELESRRER